MAGRFQGVLLFVSYWIPAFRRDRGDDWRYRSAGRTAVNPPRSIHRPRGCPVALGVFLGVRRRGAVQHTPTDRRVCGQRCTAPIRRIS